jgi:DNA (cytosine-5)-methyltransferase 1
MKPRLLDLFCGAGGCSVGYHRAGFDVVGVDINPQPNYPFEFIQADVAAWASVSAEFLRGLEYRTFDAIHASPPCQAYIRSGNVAKDGRHPDLISPTRGLLQATGLPWVIENVPGAPIRADALLCGSMFGLEVRRHRLFEFSWNEPLLTWPCCHNRKVTGVYGNPHGASGAASGMLPSDLKTWSRAMDINWMTTAELADAIPPAYTQFIGAQLMAHIRAQADPVSTSKNGAVI